MYCTLSDIEKHINKETLLFLTDDDKNGFVDSKVVESAIEKADALIDAILGNSYPLPFSQIPALIKNISVDIAIYEIYSRHPEIKSESVHKNFNDALKTLLRIVRGEINLGNEFSRLNKNKSESTTCEEEKFFSRDSLKPF